MLELRFLFLLRVNTRMEDYAILAAKEILSHYGRIEGLDERWWMLLQKFADNFQAIFIIAKECRYCLLCFFKGRMKRFPSYMRHFGESKQKQITTQGIGDKRTIGWWGHRKRDWVYSLVPFNCLLHLLSKVRKEEGAQSRDRLKFYVSLNTKSISNDRFLSIIYDR